MFTAYCNSPGKGGKKALAGEELHIPKAPLALKAQGHPVPQPQLFLTFPGFVASDGVTKDKVAIIVHNHHSWYCRLVINNSPALNLTLPPQVFSEALCPPAS